MRTRHEPKPPRPPRVFTARLVVVSLVVGVVLAVASVPASVVIDRIPWVHAWVRQTVHRFTYDQNIVTITRARRWATEGWTIQSDPVWATGHSFEQTEHGEPVTAVRDPRPGHARAWLDANGGMVQSWHAGVPLRAAYGQILVSDAWLTDPSNAAGSQIVGTWDVRAFGRNWSIPTQPHWPGLLGNTLFYGLLVLTPLVVLRWRRLRRRARRGLCLACGYELGAGIGACPACPECGLAKRGP